MADQYDAATRSRTMRSVPSVGTSAELRCAALLCRTGVRFASQIGDLPGKPDFGSLRLRLAIFVDGDFWHGRDWKESGALPKNNRAYWRRKIEGNWTRDRRTDKKLRRMRWSVIRIWESDLNLRPESVLATLLARVVRRRRDVTNTSKRT